MGNANLVGYARAATAGCRNHFLQLWLSASAVVVLLLSPASFAGTPKEAITAAGVNVQTSTPLTSVRGQPRAATLSTVGDDIPVITGDTMTQSECSVFLDPNNPLVILNSNNSSNWAKLLSRDMYLYQVTRRYGAAAWVSTDGGQTWTGNVRGVGGIDNEGDPAAAIGLNGRMYVGYIDADFGQEVAYSDDQGANWTMVQVADPIYPPVSDQLLDKNHLWVDNNPLSPYEGYLYAAWTRIEDDPPHHIEFSRSTDDGETWSPTTQFISSSLPDEYHQGVNIQTGPGGQVYAAWAVYDEIVGGTVPDETALGFAKSTDGGASWSDATYIIEGIRGHRNTWLGGGKGMRRYSFPSMSVNQQTGQIFVVWTNLGVPILENDGDPDIYMITSSDDGTTWVDTVKVNQDATHMDQWFPWIACDPVTGSLVCIFYDSRDYAEASPPNSWAETYVAESANNGQTWRDFQISDEGAQWDGDEIPGAYAADYAGDYIGIATRNNRAYPMWCDKRGIFGQMLTLVSPFYICIIEITGDVNLTGSVTSADVFYLRDYVLYSGPEPLPCPASGDVDCSVSVTIVDVIYLHNYVWHGGPAPCDVCELVHDGTWDCPQD